MTWIGFIIILAVVSGASIWAAYFFHTPIESVLRRVIADPLSRSWLIYMKFAIIVSGLFGGFCPSRVTPWIQSSHEPALLGTRSLLGWVLQGFSAALGSLMAITVLLLIFFLVTLMAHTIVRVWGPKRSSNRPNFKSRRKPS